MADPDPLGWNFFQPSPFIPRDHPGISLMRPFPGFVWNCHKT